MTPSEAVNAGWEIVRRMRAERERLGLTRVEIERLGGPTAGCLHAWERRRNKPTMIKLIQYAAVLKFRVGLLGREDD